MTELHELGARAVAAQVRAGTLARWPWRAISSAEFLPMTAVARPAAFRGKGKECPSRRSMR